MGGEGRGGEGRGGEADRQTDRHADRQTGRSADRQTGVHAAVFMIILTEIKTSLLRNGEHVVCATGFKYALDGNEQTRRRHIRHFLRILYTS